MQLWRRNAVIEVNGTDTFKSIEQMLKDRGYDLSGWQWHSIDPNSKWRVRFPSGKTMVLGYCNTVSGLISKIGSEVNVAPYEVLLFFAGMLLPLDDLPLTHYKISSGHTLDVALVFRGELKVETISGETIHLDRIEDYKTIGKMKDLVQKQTGIPTCNQRLVNVEAGEVLVDNRYFQSYRLRNGAFLRFVDDTWTASSSNEMKIYVKVVATGDIIGLDVVSSDTISSVKSMIEKKLEDYPVGQQLLYLPQKRLEDTFTLAHYYILDQDTLRLVRIPECHEDIPQDHEQGRQPTETLEAIHPST